MFASSGGNVCNSKTPNRDVSKLDRWVWDVSIDHPIAFWLAVVVIGSTFAIPLAMFLNWLAAR